jgi:hypothetical protein
MRILFVVTATRPSQATVLGYCSRIAPNRLHYIVVAFVTNAITAGASNRSWILRLNFKVTRLGQLREQTTAVIPVHYRYE